LAAKEAAAREAAAREAAAREAAAREAAAKTSAAEAAALRHAQERLASLQRQYNTLVCSRRWRLVTALASIYSQLPHPMRQAVGWMVGKWDRR
ncbi:MAG: hypothetical protein WCJ21_10495, partial [Planctomycetota bacterium]